MNLYEIEDKLYNLIENGFDAETGEILEGTDLSDSITACQMALSDKISNIACMIKNLQSDAEALKAEKAKLAKRQAVAEHKAEWLKHYLNSYLQSTVEDVRKYKYSDARCAISFRKSESVEIEDINAIPEEYIKPRTLKDTDIDKTSIKKFLKENADATVTGAELVEKENLQIK